MKVLIKKLVPIQTPRWAIAYYVFYGLVYAGWLCHRSDNPVFLGFTWRYWGWLLITFAGFAVPVLVILAKRKFGAKPLLYGSVPVLALLLGAYLLGAWQYGHSQLHPFDPFVQNTPERFDSIPKEKGKGVYRILCLGGSTTGNEDMPPEYRYPRMLEENLQKAYPGLQIEVLNAGRAWYTTRHALINYASYYADWHPDLIIVMHAMNDLIRSFRHVDFAIGEYNELWSHFYGPAIQGAKPPSYESHLLRKLKGIGIFKLASESWYSQFRYHEEAWPIERFRSLQAYARNLRRLIEISKHDGVQVVVMSEPSLYHGRMSPGEKAILRFQRECCLEKGRGWTLHYPTIESLEAAMKAYNLVGQGVAIAQGAFFVDAAQSVPQDTGHFRDDVHYTPLGARVLVEYVAAEIIRLDIIGSWPEKR